MNSPIDMVPSFEIDPYPKRDLCLVKGEGSTIWDQDGNPYIDCVTGHGVANLGHGHPGVVKAVADQLNRLVTCSNVFYNDQRSAYLKKLNSKSPQGLNRAFLCNSGTESIEAALKFARMTTGRTEFISAMRGFHGRTFGSLSLTFNPKYRMPFQPQLPGCSYVPFNKIEPLQKALNADTAAVILEVVQGEGGVNVGEKSYFQAVAECCRQNGTLLILDEVQTGFGRTGFLFAVEHLDITPDMMTIAKGMANGIPMGGVLCADSIQIKKGTHGTTFGGNPLACAAGIAVLEAFDDDNLLCEVRRKGAFLRTQLESLSSKRIKAVRGLGLMIGVELNQRVQPIVMELMGKRVLALPAGPKVLRLLPPLTISDEEIKRVVSVLADVLN